MNRLFFLALVLLSSCTSLHTVSSSIKTNDKNNEYSYYDSESKIRYQISNDADNLYIKLNTAEFSTIAKILKTGLTIYFDTKGKKNDEVYFQYPMAQNQQQARSNTTNSGNAQPQDFDLTKFLSQNHNEALFSKHGVNQRFLVKLEKSNIQVSINPINNNEITYDLLIPFNRISNEGISSLSNLSLGIVSGEIDGPPMSGGNNSMQGGSNQKGMHGGGGGGGGGRGRSNGMQGGSRPAGMDRSLMATPISFWFKVNLQQIK